MSRLRLIVAVVTTLLDEALNTLLNPLGIAAAGGRPPRICHGDNRLVMDRFRRLSIYFRHESIAAEAGDRPHRYDRGQGNSSERT